MIEMLIKIISVIGTIDTLVLVGLIIWAFIGWTRGILPALWRLGNGLSKRRIAIFATGQSLNGLRDLLIDSKIFNGRNIVGIENLGEIGRAQEATIFLVSWHDWSANIDDILRLKKDGTAMVVYAPQELGFLLPADVTKINMHRNSLLTNFRGRLLNDLVSSMITTSYER